VAICLLLQILAVSPSLLWLPRVIAISLFYRVSQCRVNIIYQISSTCWRLVLVRGTMYLFNLSRVPDRCPCTIGRHETHGGCYPSLVRCTCGTVWRPRGTVSVWRWWQWHIVRRPYGLSEGTWRCIGSAVSFVVVKRGGGKISPALLLLRGICCSPPSSTCLRVATDALIPEQRSCTV
jgi:hypothetical protein